MRVAAALAALALAALALAACDDAPALSPAGTPTAAAPPTASPTVEPTAAATPSPTPEATPAATPSPTPSPSPTPTPAPTPTLGPLPTREELGIREVDVEEMLAGAGVTHTLYGAGEEVPWDPGLFLLDTASGAVESWVWSLAGVPEEERREIAKPPDIGVSPSGRFLELDGVLYDRRTGSAYRLGRAPLDQWWGYGSSERLLFHDSRTDAFVALDGDLQPVARFRLPEGERLTSPAGGYVLVRDWHSTTAFHLVNLEDEASPAVYALVLPWEPDVVTKDELPLYRIDLLDEIVAVVGSAGGSVCRVTRYDLRGVMLSDQDIPCLVARAGWWNPADLPRISPDGRLIAATTFDGFRAFGYGDAKVGGVVSVFDAATGAEVARILGAHPAWMRAQPRAMGGDVWLADSSTVVVQTRDGFRAARLDRTWGPSPGWPSPGQRDLFLSQDWTSEGSIVSTVNRQGTSQASVKFGPPSAAIPDPGHQAALVLWKDISWRDRGGTILVSTSYFFSQHFDDYYGMPPLAPVIEPPPFEDRFLVEVVVDTCLNIREEPSLDAPIVTCLLGGAVAETADFYVSWDSEWLHLRTDDGVEGWASADYLRWHSDGVRLEE